MKKRGNTACNRMNFSADSNRNNKEPDSHQATEPHGYNLIGLQLVFYEIKRNFQTIFLHILFHQHGKFNLITLR